MSQVIQDQPNFIDLEVVKACPICGSQRLDSRDLMYEVNSPTIPFIPMQWS